MLDDITKHRAAFDRRIYALGPPQRHNRRLHAHSRTQRRRQRRSQKRRQEMHELSRLLASTDWGDITVETGRWHQRRRRMSGLRSPCRASTSRARVGFRRQSRREEDRRREAEAEIHLQATANCILAAAASSDAAVLGLLVTLGYREPGVQVSVFICGRAAPRPPPLSYLVLHNASPDSDLFAHKGKPQVGTRKWAELSGTNQIQWHSAMGRTALLSRCSCVRARARVCVCVCVERRLDRRLYSQFRSAQQHANTRKTALKTSVFGAIPHLSALPSAGGCAPPPPFYLV